MINSNRITDRFISLAEIDSPSFGERQMADRLTSELKKLGFLVEEDQSGMGEDVSAGNIYAYLPGTKDETPLLFSGHMDTVQPALNKKAILHPDGAITSDGTTVLGADDVAGLTAILEALNSIKEDNLPHRPIEILFTIGEELYDRGSEVFDYGKIRSKEAYVLDLSGPIGWAAYAAPTICSFTVEVFGKSAHAGFNPEKGFHAIATAAEAISRLKMGYIDDKTTLNIGTIEGGTAANIVPDHCIVEGEIRSFLHEKAEQTLESVVETFKAASVSSGATCACRSRFGCRSYEIPQDHKVIRRYSDACKIIGAVSKLSKTFGGSDASQFEQHGIVSLVIANAMYKTHSCKEYTTAADLKKVSEIVQLLILSTY